MVVVESEVVFAVLLWNILMETLMFCTSPTSSGVLALSQMTVEESRMHLRLYDYCGSRTVHEKGIS